MAFSTEFIMGAGGGDGSGIDLSTHVQTVTPSSTATTVGEPHVVDKAGVYAVAALGNLTDAPASGSALLELLVNGTVVEASEAVADAASISCFTTMYFEAGDTITMRVSVSGLSSMVLYEPTIAVAPVDTVGDGTVHAGGPTELRANRWEVLALHIAARSGVVLVDYGANFAAPGSMQSGVLVNGQMRIGNPVRVANERWCRAVSVNAGDQVLAALRSSAFAANQRVVNNWTVSFH